jgi:hypothetical protein
MAAVKIKTITNELSLLKGVAPTPSTKQEGNTFQYKIVPRTRAVTTIYTTSSNSTLRRLPNKNEPVRIDKLSK